MKIDLTTGEVIEGTFVRLDPARLIFETSEGVREVPLSLIPRELLDCWPDAPDTLLWRAIEQIQAAAEMQKTGCERIEEISRAVGDQTASIARQQSRMEQMEAEIAELRSERDELRARLGEIE